MKSRKSQSAQPQLKDRANRYLQNRDYEKARELYLKIYPQDTDGGRTAISLARCYANLNQWSEANKIYQKIHATRSKDIMDVVRGEAYLLLSHYPEALNFFRQADAKRDDLEARFWLACMYFMIGYIARCRELLEDIVQLKDLWEEDDPKEALLQKVLSRLEMQDFSTIYLDAWEYETEGNENPLNRWVLLSSPSMSLFNAIHQPQVLNPLARKFTSYLAQEDYFVKTFTDGRQMLYKVISDFKSDQEGHNFGEILSEKFQSQDYPGLARLILGLQIEHLKQFSSYFGLTQVEVEQSEFNDLLTKLPYRIAIAMQFLLQLSVTASEPESLNFVIENEDIFAILVQICFATFYEDVNYYLQLQKEFALDTTPSE